uniref:LRRCT domain-containing protein n=1 Tax=Timema monikensis TaxID=170555 RepID=A0A7R9E819_9NEOP|nr:unnamed protein product [Timema monikensis]
MWLGMLGALVVCAATSVPSREWVCPDINRPPSATCSCDLPHTLRCAGDRSALRVIGRALRGLTGVSLLDCTVQDVVSLVDPVLEVTILSLTPMLVFPLLPQGVSLHGLVVSSGELRRVSERAFSRLVGPLQALGLPNNRLESVPTGALAILSSLDRLDLSHNVLRSLTGRSFRITTNQLAAAVTLNVRQLTRVNLAEDSNTDGATAKWNRLETIHDDDDDDEYLYCLRVLLLVQVIHILASYANVVGKRMVEFIGSVPVSAWRNIGKPFRNNQPWCTRLGLKPPIFSLPARRSNLLPGLTNLTFLDLSDNSLGRLDANTFSPLPVLLTLRLKGNKLGVAGVAALQGLPALQELDLGSNLLGGPLGPKTLPPLLSLRVLQLPHNQLSSIRSDALSGVATLMTLSLHHNQIDVLEDHAFRSLCSLTQLDLAHNRIVAVSGSSLAHLTQLVQLDLSHNFLRALTADLVLPLRSLRELRLDDNDISMVTADALPALSALRRLTLADNPLNCDCSMSPFAEWLTNTSQVPPLDRETPVCATPPSLENGLLGEVSPEDLVCGEESDDLAPPGGPLSPTLPVSTQVMLRSFQYDGAIITLVWHVEVAALPYSCDNLFVYEEIGSHEVLVESSPLHCNSSEVASSQVLPVSFPSEGYLPGRRYRYCVVLLVGGAATSDEMVLGLGCSDVIPLVLTTSQFEARSEPVFRPGLSSISIASLHANVTSAGTMLVGVQIWNQVPSQPKCLLTAAVFAAGALVVQRHFNCSAPHVAIPGLSAGPYRVCVSIGNFPSTGPHSRCITAHQAHAPRGMSGLDVVLPACFAVLTSLLLLGLYLAIRHFSRQPKILQTHQCFLAGPPEEQQHSRYVKLHATTKL